MPYVANSGSVPCSVAVVDKHPPSFSVSKLWRTGDLCFTTWPKITFKTRQLFFIKTEEEEKKSCVGSTFQFPKFILSVYYILVASESALACKYFLSFL